MRTYKLLIAQTENMARLYRDALGLDPELWRIYGYGAALAGIRADTIVVLPPHDWSQVTPAYRERVANWIETSVRCRLTPGGKLTGSI